MTGGGSSGEVSDVVDVDDHVISTKRKNCDNYCNKENFFEVISGRKIFPNVSKKCNFNLRRFKAPDDIFLTAGSRHSSTELVFMLLPKLPWV